MNWLDRGLHPQPWMPGHGCIVALHNPDGTPPSMEDALYYGGAFVCEGINNADQQFVLLAIRQRDILWRFCASIGNVANTETANLLKDMWGACYAEGEQLDAEWERVAGQSRWRDDVRTAFWMWMSSVSRQLPEYATRARIEMIPPYLPLRLVYDDVEYTWACKGNGRSPALLGQTYSWGSQSTEMDIEDLKRMYPLASIEVLPPLEVDIPF